jgi:hypothetical protein
VVLADFGYSVFFVFLLLKRPLNDLAFKYFGLEHTKRPLNDLAFKNFGLEHT